MNAKEIRAALLVRGVLLVDIAKKCGVSRGHISNCLSGRSKSKKIEIAIIKALGCKKSDVWNAS